MKNAYPIIISKGSKFYIADIPDFGISTQGTSIPDTMEMARDAIGIIGIDMEDDGEALPAPTDISKLSQKSGAIITLVDVDFIDYRRKNDTRSVKKNCTLPGWLNYEAEKANINFSALLQNAVKDYLHLT